jgi:hypothetical protein
MGLGSGFREKPIPNPGSRVKKAFDFFSIPLYTVIAYHTGTDISDILCGRTKI